METPQVAESGRMGPTEGGQFRWSELTIWLVAAALVGLASAWIAEIGQTYFAPLLVFPLLVGVALGAVMVGVMRIGQIAHRPTIMLGTVLAVAVAVVGQHYIGSLAAYRWPMERAAAREGLQGEAAELLKGATPGFGEFLCREAERGRPLVGTFVARGRLAWLSWAVDGLLVLAAALAMVIPMMRQPYCTRCRSWYRTIRAGRVDVAAARQMAQWAGLATVDRPKRARYRLACCQGGCGPTRLELSWEGMEGEILTERAWLGNALRNRINESLDQATAEEEAGQ